MLPIISFHGPAATLTKSPTAKSTTTSFSCPLRASISSAYKLAEAINLSVQMIYTYIAIVLAFFDDFKILNNSKEYYNPQNFNEKYFFINCVNLSQADYRFDFFEFYNWLLFMQKFRNNVSPPITISISKVPPT